MDTYKMQKPDSYAAEQNEHSILGGPVKRQNAFVAPMIGGPVKRQNAIYGRQTPATPTRATTTVDSAFGQDRFGGSRRRASKSRRHRKSSRRIRRRRATRRHRRR